MRMTSEYVVRLVRVGEGRRRECMAGEWGRGVCSGKRALCPLAHKASESGRWLRDWARCHFWVPGNLFSPRREIASSAGHTDWSRVGAVTWNKTREMFPFLPTKVISERGKEKLLLSLVDANGTWKANKYECTCNSEREMLCTAPTTVTRQVQVDKVVDDDAKSGFSRRKWICKYFWVLIIGHLPHSPECLMRTECLCWHANWRRRHSLE